MKLSATKKKISKIFQSHIIEQMVHRPAPLNYLYYNRRNHNRVGIVNKKAFT